VGITKSSNMIIQVSFTAGTDLEKALKEAKEKALFLDVAFVEFNFNGVNFFIGRTANIEEALYEYHKPKRILHSVKA